MNKSTYTNMFAIGFQVQYPEAMVINTISEIEYKKIKNENRIKNILKKTLWYFLFAIYLIIVFALITWLSVFILRHSSFSPTLTGINGGLGMIISYYLWLINFEPIIWRVGSTNKYIYITV